MRLLLVGHRGVGKTSLLRRIETYFQRAGRLSARFFDLDAEVRRLSGKSIEDIFAEEGEERFRALEEAALRNVCESGHDCVIALGAGYRGWLPEGAEVIWVRRVTDEWGRIFLNRPRLSPELPPLDEFFSRKKARDLRYSEQSDLSLFLREGVGEFDRGEFEFFTGAYRRRSGFLTLKPDMKSAVLRLPAEKFEMRDDLVGRGLFGPEPERILLSKRDAAGWIETPDDWPLELGEVRGSPSIVSAHERSAEESVEEFLRRLERTGGDRVLKAAPLVETFEELWRGFVWQRKEPAKRAFLPRSADGRWKWFRLFMKGKMPVNFWRLDAGSAADQPTLVEWLNHPDGAREFAAVLGDPVLHSRTPVEQEDFFSAMEWPVYAVRASESEWTEAFSVLTRMGLRAAAVTSPLKKHAFYSATEKSAEAESAGAVNTLFIDGRKVHGHNTDLFGFQRAIAEQSFPKPVAVWGGGGTLAVIRRVFPDAVPFSARTGRSRDDGDEAVKPRTLIWACGRDDSYLQPPENWNLEVIFDMNYTENSTARALALSRRCRYVDGLTMFKAQAEGQRIYWRSLLEGKTR